MERLWCGSICFPAVAALVIMGSLDAYEPLEVVGKGSFGEVRKIRRRADGKTLVWKELSYGAMSEKEKHQLVAEVNILRELRHPSIVRYYDRVIDKTTTQIFIIMEYCPHGDLAQVIKSTKRKSPGAYIPEDSIWKIFTQILQAIHACHTRPEGKVLHRDLKPGNIFLDANHQVKLGDFGLAKLLDAESEYAKTHVGTPYYMSPEQIKEAWYNEKSDIWSLGCLVYELAALAPPFEASSHQHLAEKILDGRYSRIPARYSEELWRVVRWMIQQKSSRRPSTEELLAVPHVWMLMREKRYKDHHAAVQKLAEEVKAKQRELDDREAGLAAREQDLARREAAREPREARRAALVTAWEDPEDPPRYCRVPSGESDVLRRVTEAQKENTRPGGKPLEER